jgi:anti-anti-sigma factor
MTSPGEEMLRIATELDGERATVSMSGELDLASAGRLDTTIAELCTDGVRRILLEMGELSFMDSTGLRSVLISAELCAVNGCELLIGSTSPQVERLFEVSGVGEQLPRRAETA